MSQLLEGQVALVTGGGQGIGRAVAILCAEEGASVSVVDLDAELASATAAEVTNRGGSAIGVAADVGNRKQVDEAVRATVEQFGTIDVLVNLAIAGAPRVPFMETTEELCEKMWRSGTLGTMFFIQACHPHMKNRNGKVINFASGAAVSGDIGYAAYAPAKEGVRALTKVAARELGQDGIRVNAICPAAKTRLMQAWIDEDPERAAETEGAVALRRFGEPEDIARAVIMLASDYSGYVTGHTLMVDGGSCRW